MKNPYRKFLQTYLAWTLTLTGLIIAFNIVIDPYRLYNPHGNDTFANHKNPGRIGKFIQSKNPTYTGIILGSSRAEVGIDPTAPPLNNAKWYNLGLSNVTLTELHLALQSTLTQNPHIKHLILFAEYFQFNKHHNPGPDFTNSPFNPNQNPIEQYFANHLGIPTLKKSTQTLRQYFKDQPGRHNPRGQMIKPLWKPGSPIRNLFKPGALGSFEKPTFTYDPSRIDRFINILKLAAKHHVQTTIIIPPSHAVWFERLAQKNALQNLHQFKSDLTNRVRQLNQSLPTSLTPFKLWDFAYHHPLNTQPIPPQSDTITPIQYWYDPVHFKPALANLFLTKAIANKPATPVTPTPFGTNLLNTNLQKHLQTTTNLRKTYLQTNPATNDLLTP